MATNEGARKDDAFKVVCITPDVCLTPMGSSMPPVPYQIVGILDKSKIYSPNVNFAGYPAMTMKGFVAEVKGDEAGKGGGVKSGVNKKYCIPITFSPTVRANKNNVLFQKDTLMWMNGPAPQGTGNTIGKLVYEGSTPRASDVSEDKSADPPVFPEIPAEQSFLSKLGSMAGKLTSDQGITGLVNMAPQMATMDWSNPGSVLGAVGGIAGLGGLGTIANAASMAAKATGVAQAGMSLANFNSSNPGSYMGAASTLAGVMQFTG